MTDKLNPSQRPIAHRRNLTLEDVMDSLRDLDNKIQEFIEDNEDGKKGSALLHKCPPLPPYVSHP